jgi:hypothetical protein
MNVRCNYCGHSFNLSPEYIAQAVERAIQKKYRYHAVECVNCRKQVKVAVVQMQPYLRPAEEATEPASEPEPPAEAADA